MKRPEGFDAVAPQTPQRGVASPVREKSVREKAPREKPVREKPPRPQNASRRVPRPSADRVAASELRLAERARKRAERRELRRFTRRARHRRVAWLVAFGTAAALVGLSLAAVYSPLLALREIRVEGASRVDPAQLITALDGQLGTPLALLDEDLIRAELAEFTLIRSYTTELLPPGTLLIHITERTPIGSVVRGAQFDLVDPAGVVIASSPGRPEGVPVIQVAGAELDSAAFRSVAEVLRAMPEGLRSQLDTVAASTRDDVTLTLNGSVQRVEWGSAERSAHKSRVLAALLAIHGGSGPGLYDVSAPGTAVFRAD